MPYFSTRGGACVTASQAILQGIAPDGGLFVPAVLPVFDRTRLIEMAGLGYKERALAVLRCFLEDFSDAEIRDALRSAYGGQFNDERIAPLRRIQDGVYILELFHGPTLAFKDMALQLLPYLISVSARKCGEKREVCILVSTSGDTGKAALEGFKDVPGTSCTVFYPLEGVSEIQQLQMTTTGGSNTHVIAVRGNFDDAQTGMKKLFLSKEFIARMDAAGRLLSSANSINFGRLVPQIVYYFSAYADLIASGRITAGEAVNFVVPTGNFGNILAGYYARRMGLPVKKLICASNRNKVLADFFRTGIYSTHRTFFKTISPSMDILVSSNLERLLYEFADRDGDLVTIWMRQLRESGSYSVGEQRLDSIREYFAAGFADDQQTKKEIALRFEEDGCLMDPHTAVASAVLREYQTKTHDMTPAVIVSTASPFKFSGDVLDAVSPGATHGLDAFASADELSRISGLPVPPQIKALKNLPVIHTISTEPGEEAMAQAVLRAFGETP